jgi:tetrahydromethanopterin S-methyltransferase subunit A
MIPQKGQSVAVMFRNGYKIEGTVISWSDGKSVLKSLTGSSTVIIQKTIDDVMLVKINNAQEIYKEIKEKPIKQESDLQTLANMKNELNELERSELREKMNEHKPNGMREINYGFAGNNIKINGALKYTREKTTGSNPGFDTELQGLFIKKY